LFYKRQIIKDDSFLKSLMQGKGLYKLKARTTIGLIKAMMNRVVRVKHWEEGRV